MLLGWSLSIFPRAGWLARRHSFSVSYTRFLGTLACLFRALSAHKSLVWFFDMTRHTGTLDHISLPQDYLGESFDVTPRSALSLSRFSIFFWDWILDFTGHVGLLTSLFWDSSCQLVLLNFMGTLACTNHSFGYYRFILVVVFSKRIGHVGMSTITPVKACFFSTELAMGLVGKPTGCTYSDGLNLSNYILSYIVRIALSVLWFEFFLRQTLRLFDFSALRV